MCWSGGGDARVERVSLDQVVITDRLTRTTTRRRAIARRRGIAGRLKLTEIARAESRVNLCGLFPA
jgi:hypothetical protein